MGFKVEINTGIEVINKYFSNSEKEDFAKYLPNVYGVEMLEIKFFKLSYSDNLYMLNNPLDYTDVGIETSFYDFSESGKILAKRRNRQYDEVLDVDEEIIAVLKDIQGTEVKPIYKDDDFKGFEIV